MARCSECTYMKLPDCLQDGEIKGVDTKGGKFWCKYYDWVLANHDACSYFCRAGNREPSVCEKAEEYSRGYGSSSGCYITTALCNILSMNDNDLFLTVLRVFRDKFLQKSDDGLKILMQYDVIGALK